MSEAAKTLTVNGEARQTQARTVADLLEELQLATRRVAVMVNEEVVPRSEFAVRGLSESDRVELISLIGGG